MESKPVENWSLCMHGQCIDIISDLHDVFIGDGGKYEFTYEVKRIGNKYETQAIINLKKTKSRSRTVLKYKIHVEVRDLGDLSLLREIKCGFTESILYTTDLIIKRVEGIYAVKWIRSKFKVTRCFHAAHTSRLQAVLNIAKALI